MTGSMLPQPSPNRDRSHGVGRVTTLLVGVLDSVDNPHTHSVGCPLRQTYIACSGAVSLWVAWYTTYRGYALGNVAIVSVLSSI
ncbi:MAG UNVERIFIED_CONTAM: hypothetical protein LVT10_06040 [Anaerolineae bacterium]